LMKINNLHLTERQWAEIHPNCHHFLVQDYIRETLKKEKFILSTNMLPLPSFSPLLEGLRSTIFQAIQNYWWLPTKHCTIQRFNLSASW
jgi:hypothetical protein